jgi:hypothetical protein
MSKFLRRIACWLLLLLGVANAAGCFGIRPARHLRDQWRENNNSDFSDSPSLPKAEFGREKSGMPATGSDRRAREIEESLGVGG